MNNKLFTLLLIFFGLFVAGLITRNGDLLWLACPFLAYLAVGLLCFPATDRVRLSAQRGLAPVIAGEMPSLNVQVTLENSGISIPSLYIQDSPPAGLSPATGDTSLHTSLPAGRKATLLYTFPQKRGRYTWDEIQAWVSDPFGLLATPVTLPAPAQISIQPRLDQFRRLPFHARNTLHAPGSIPARLAGSGTDFWGVRPYHPGDSLRRFDWRLSARHPGQFFTREFEQEEVADIGLILDARQQMDLQVGEDSLFEHTVRATASLAEACLHQGHRVSLLVAGENILRVFPGYGKVQLQAILRCLSGVKPDPNRQINNLETLRLQMFSSRALLVVLSPLGKLDYGFFQRLRASGCQVMLICPDPYDFAGDSLPADTPSQQAERLSRLERLVQLRLLARLNIQVIDWPVSQPLSPLIRTGLGHLRGQVARRLG